MEGIRQQRTPALLELILDCKTQNKLTWRAQSCVLVESHSVQYYQDCHRVRKPRYSYTRQMLRASRGEPENACMHA